MRPVAAEGLGALLAVALWLLVQTENVGPPEQRVAARIMATVAPSWGTMCPAGAVAPTSHEHVEGGGVGRTARRRTSFVLAWLQELGRERAGVRTQAKATTAVLLLVVLLAAGAAAYHFAPRAYHVHVLELRGRIVDAATGTPLRGTWVLTLPAGARDRWQTGVAEYRRARAEGRWLRDESGARIGIGGGAPEWAEVRSGEDGRFSMRVGVPVSIRLILGVFPTRTTPSPRSGVGALHLEVVEGSSAVWHASGGEWELAPSGSRLWATWDLGDVPFDLGR